MGVSCFLHFINVVYYMIDLLILNGPRIAGINPTSYNPCIMFNPFNVLLDSAC